MVATGSTQMRLARIRAIEQQDQGVNLHFQQGGLGRLDANDARYREYLELARGSHQAQHPLGVRFGAGQAIAELLAADIGVPTTFFDDPADMQVVFQNHEGIYHLQADHPEHARLRAELDEARRGNDRLWFLANKTDLILLDLLPAEGTRVTRQPAEQEMNARDPQEDDKAQLGMQDYLNATSDASKRTRATAYAIVIASILLFAALLNALQIHWMRQRLNKLNDPDSKYVSDLIGKPVKEGDADYEPRKQRYKDLYSNFMRTYIDNSFVVRVPFFGITFDMNDSGLIGGIGFIILLLIMRFCLSREEDNLKLAFQVASRHGHLDDFYHLLAMNQVLTIPPRTTINRTNLLLWTPKIFITLPLLVHAGITTNDLFTREVGFELESIHTYVLLFFEISFLVAIFFLTLNVVRRFESIDSLWERMGKQVELPHAGHIALKCQNRFDTIVFEMLPEVKEGKQDPYDYYERYWDLQHDQYFHWKDHLINDQLYSQWTRIRHLEWQRNDKVRGVTYQAGWQHVVAKNAWANSEFVRFMAQVFSGEHPLVKAYRAS